MVIAIINEAELLKLAETMTTSQLAARYGVSTAIIRRRLDQIHEDGPQRTRKKSKLPHDRELLHLATTLTNAEIAQRYGTQTGTVARAIARACRTTGQEVKRQGGAPVSKSKLPPDRELVKLYETMTQAEIGARYGVVASTVHKALQRARENLGVKALRKSKGGAGRPPGSRDSPSASYDGPPYDELDDALRRWGMDGAAEEYDVDTAQVAAWMRALDI